MRKLSLYYVTLFLFLSCPVALSAATQADVSETQAPVVGQSDDLLMEQPVTDAAPVVDGQRVSGVEASEEGQSVQDEAEQPVETVVQKPIRKELDIWGADHALTKKYTERYLRDRDRKWIIEALDRSVLYRPYIVERLERMNLPLILQYLPIVESNYNVYAVSYAGATGIWQFMTNSMGTLLKKNTWFDDRRDPWKSTDAALVKLSENYAYFGDWAIAIAAYNCGTGAMNKVVKTHKGMDFWTLAEKGYLKTQSAQYVPKLLAIADIVENAEYYGVLDVKEADQMIGDEPADTFDFIVTNGMYSMEQIASVTDSDASLLLTLNPALLRGCTPARQEYFVRLPKGTLTKDLTPDVAVEKLKALGTPNDAIVYTVQPGDTLWALSRKYKLTVQDLCDVNGISEKAYLRIKQKLIIPLF